MLEFTCPLSENKSGLWFGSTTTLDMLYARNISRPGTFISIVESDKNIKTKEVYINYESKYEHIMIHNLFVNEEI